MPPGRGRAAPPQGTCRPGPHLQHGGGGGRSLLGPYNRRDGGHSGARGSDRRCSLPEHRPPLPDPAPGVRHRDLPAVHSRRPGDHGENRRPASGSSHGVHGEFEERDHRSALNSCGLQHGDRRDNYQEGHVRRHSHPCNRPSILGPFRRYHGDQLGDRENCPEHPNHDGRSGYGGHRTSLVSYPDVPSDLVNHHGNCMGHSHHREQCDGQRAPSGDCYRGNNHGNQALRDIGRSWALEAPRHLEGCYRRSAADQRGTPGCGTLEHQNGALLPTPDHQQATRHARRGAHRSKHVVEPRTVHVGRSGTNRPPDTTTMAVHSGILPTPLQPSSLPAPGRAAPALLPAPSLKPAPATTALSVVVTRSQTNTALLPTPSCVATPANTTPSLLPKRTDACLLLRPPHTHLQAAASLLPTPPNRNLAAPRAAQTGPSPLDTPLLPTPLHSAVHSAHALLPIRPKITPSTSSSTRLLPIPTQPSSALLPTPSQPSSALLPTPSQPSSSLLPTSSQHYSSLLPTPSQPSSSLLPTPTQPSALLPNPSRNDSPLLPTPVRPSLLPTPTALLRGATTGWTGSNAEGSDEWVNDSSTALVSCSARPGVGPWRRSCASSPTTSSTRRTSLTSTTTSGGTGGRCACRRRRRRRGPPDCSGCGPQRGRGSGTRPRPMSATIGRSSRGRGGPRRGRKDFSAEAGHDNGQTADRTPSLPFRIIIICAKPL
ncbi:hypothetical protein ONE63_001112 [Megalurothrips usitatus]|uniref:Uncharacterized protein n=1 Tax=Megalurothrips usitatus TaxID=439358 RepID=A0AAV7XFH1_9NEOP|nr:hypothetical protein ONE63_001112 [Megalurothrips usitatus]